VTLPTATDPAAEFCLPVRVYYEDSDAGGVVYYANYLRFMERARTEWLRTLGFEQDELSRDPGVVFAVRACTLEFRKPARFNDLLEVTVRVIRLGGASLTFAQQVRCHGELMCEGEVRVACLDAQQFSPRPLPETMLGRLSTVSA